MSKIIVAYWSQTGNTAAMAAAIGQGITDGGKESVVADVSSISMDDLKAADVFAMASGEGLILNETPDADGLEACAALGKELAALK